MAGGLVLSACGLGSVSVNRKNISALPEGTSVSTERPGPLRPPEIFIAHDCSKETRREKITWLDFISLQHGIVRYMDVENSLPKSFDELLKAGYLFFVPKIKINRWEIVGNALEVEVVEHHPVKNGLKVFTARYRLGSPDELHPEQTRYLRSKARENIREGQRKAAARNGGQVPKDSIYYGISEEDVMSGRISESLPDEYRGYSANDTEFRQLYWADDLCRLLYIYCYEYSPGSAGQFPSNARELLEFIGDVVPRGWIAPMTGKPVKIQDHYDGQNAGYVVSNGGRKIEIFVPLFGAGASKKPHPFMRGFERLGVLKPGEYFYLKFNSDSPADSIYMPY